MVKINEILTSNDTPDQLRSNEGGKIYEKLALLKSNEKN